MATAYELRLNFDPTVTTGLFSPYNAAGNTGRVWFSNGQFAGNPDTYAPELNLNNGDTVQFSIGPSSTPSPSISGVVINVIFSTDRKASNNPSKIASPFALSGNPRCILSDPPVYSAPWYSIGAYGLSINTANSGNGKLKFEFSIAARITFSDGSTKDFGYDPEMDVDV